MATNLGYTKNLSILPFDHRTSFLKVFHDKNSIVVTKWIIYEAFKIALLKGVPKEEAAILVDEQFGDKILHDAKSNGFTTLLTTEKSGQREFAFEYGTDFDKHIEKYKPAFTKALIRYNPEDDIQSKAGQQKTLKILSDYCHKNGYKFLLEVLISPIYTSEEPVPVTSEESIRPPPRWTKEEYDKKERPKLQVLAIRELQSASVEPDVWKLEGSESEKDYQTIVNQAKTEGRDNVGIVVLGRGETQEKIEKWVSVGTRVKGVIGFAVGRTVFWEPLVDLRNGKVSKEQTIHTIANNFKYFYDVFMKGGIKV